MLFRYEPALFENIFSRTEPVEQTFPRLFSRLAFLDAVNEYPYVSIADNKDAVHIAAEVPGVAKDNVKIQLENGALTISGERKTPEEGKDSEWLRQEIRYGSFSRTIQLPEGVYAEKITAEYNDGVVRITLPKQEAAKPKEIVIR